MDACFYHSSLTRAEKKNKFRLQRRQEGKERQFQREIGKLGVFYVTIEAGLVGLLISGTIGLQNL